MFRTLVKCPYCRAEWITMQDLNPMRLCICESDDVECCGKTFLVVKEVVTNYITYKIDKGE